VSATVCRPITIVESGPASGIHAAAALGRLLGRPNIIALDIGGTTAKCALVEGGNVPITTEYNIEKTRRFPGYPIMTPTVDIVEIGNGGGSIAWIDPYGALHVGPQSAGASPGPVAYGRGGVEPTTTDANLVTRRIDPRNFCAGAVDPDMAAVGAAFDRLGSRLGMTGVEAARGVLRVANHNMINALKLISVNRGHDPRDFVLVAFGGGGGMHGAFLARELKIPTVIVPANAAVFSAWGMLMADLRRDYIVTRPVMLNDSATAQIRAAVADIEREATREYGESRANGSTVEFEYFADVRYDGQANTVKVQLSPELRAGASVDGFIELFRAAYERQYGYRLDSAIELVNLHVIAFGRTRQVGWTSEPSGPTAAQGALIEHRVVEYDIFGSHDAAIYDREALRPGMGFHGPSIIQESGTTTVILPGDTVTIDEYRNIIINTGRN
jgi:N-methylhydantoinase A